jgi:hypothetical protein
MEGHGGGAKEDGGQISDKIFLEMLNSDPPSWATDLNIEHIIVVWLSAEAGVEKAGEVSCCSLEDRLHLLPPEEISPFICQKLLFNS